MKSKIKHAALLATLASFASGTALATNGYFSDGTGAKNRGMGGAGTALAQEAGSIVLNPATAAKLGDRLDVGGGIFSPSPRAYSIGGNTCGSNPAPFTCGGSGTLDGGQESDRDYFLIPFFGQNLSLDDASGLGLTVTALGGMNTDYKNHPFANFGGSGRLGIDLKQVNFGLTYAREINDKLSLGATLSMIVQQFKASGLDVFGAFGMSADATKMSGGADTSTGFGIKLGALYDLGNDMTLGFAYSPKVDMSEFDDYAGLFAEAGDFDIPSTLSIGFAMNITPEILFAIDIYKINYTDVAAISNDSQRVTDICLPARIFDDGNGRDGSDMPGGANGAGFGWDDMTVIKLGAAYQADETMVYRAGWNYGKSPIESEDVTFNIIAPAVVENHLTLGLTKQISSSAEITLDFIHSFKNNVTGEMPAGFGGGYASIAMEQNFIEIQFGKRF